MTYKAPTDEQLERLERIDAGLNAIGTLSKICDLLNCTDENVERERDLFKERDTLPDPIKDFMKFAKDKTQKELGAVLVELIAEATYDMNWEGYTEAQVTGVRKLLADLMVSHERLTDERKD